MFCWGFLEHVINLVMQIWLIPLCPLSCERPDWSCKSREQARQERRGTKPLFWCWSAAQLPMEQQEPWINKWWLAFQHPSVALLVALLMCSVGSPTQALVICHPHCAAWARHSKFWGLLSLVISIKRHKDTFLKPLCRQGKAVHSWEKEKLSLLS